MPFRTPRSSLRRWRSLFAAGACATSCRQGAPAAAARDVCVTSARDICVTSQQPRCLFSTAAATAAASAPLVSRNSVARNNPLERANQTLVAERLNAHSPGTLSKCPEYATWAPRGMLTGRLGCWLVAVRNQAGRMGDSGHLGDGVFDNHPRFRVW
eukprot:4549301-Pyramimonas_sp.AAC.2